MLLPILLLEKLDHQTEGTIDFAPSFHHDFTDKQEDWHAPGPNMPLLRVATHIGWNVLEFSISELVIISPVLLTTGAMDFT